MSHSRPLVRLRCEIVLLCVASAGPAPSALAALFADIPGLSASARTSIVAYYDGRVGVVTGYSNNIHNVTSWTPVDGTGAPLSSMVVTQAGNGPDIITYDASGTLSFSSASTTTSQQLRGRLAAAAGTAYTVFWKGLHKTPAPGQDSGNYVYNISNELNHQRDVDGTTPAIELYDGTTTFRGADIRAYDTNTTVWTTVYNGNSHTAYANGFNLTVPGTPSYNVPADPEILIGAFDAGGFDFNGELSHLLIFNSALSAADRALVERYLVLAAGFPDIRIAPLAIAFNITNFAASNPGAAHAAVESQVTETALSPEQKLLAIPKAFEQFEKGEQRVHVIVNLSSSPGRPRGHEWNSRAKLAEWHRRVKSRQDEVLTTLPATDFQLKRRFQNQNGFSGFVTRKGLEKLARHPQVLSVEVAEKVELHLAQGIPLINAATYRSNFSGAGISIAIVDTGIDYTHPRLGGGPFPNSKVIGGYDFAADDNDPFDNVFAHGTACAGIAAGSLGTVGDYIGGVVPEARIYALKVVTPNGYATEDDIAAAWDWCVTHKNDDPANPLLVISTSLGLGRYTSHCDAEKAALATAAANAAAAGITVLVSSGNNGFCDSVTWPACLSGVISVGGVYDATYANVISCVTANSCGAKSRNTGCFTGYSASEPGQPDKVVHFANTSTFLDLLAPAYRSYTTDVVGAPGYSSGDYATTFSGTSAACPYAAGAVAALQLAAQAKLGRFLTPAEARLSLVTSGDLVTDTKVAITKPRINVGRAIETLGPDSSFVIFNDGDATLDVTSLTLDSPAPWLSWTPNAPFRVPPGSAQLVALTIDANFVPFGVTTRQIVVNSSDPDQNPSGLFLTTTNLGPVLHATRGSDTIVISWPTNATGFALQSSDTLPRAKWANVSAIPTVIGPYNFVTNPISQQHRFYRLTR